MSGCLCPGQIARKAQHLFEKGAVDAAYRIICQAPIAPDRNPGIWYLRVRLGMAANEWQHAYRDLSQLQQVIAPQRKLHMAQIDCLLALGQYKQAAVALHTAGDNLSGTWFYHLVWARINAASNATERTLFHLLEAIDLNEELATKKALSSPELSCWVLHGLVDCIPTATAA